MKIKYLVVSTTIIAAFLFTCIITGCGSKAQADSKAVENEEKTEKSDVKVIKLTTAEFKQKVFDFTANKEWKYIGEKPCIVDFYADWCRPCKMIAPIMEELAVEYQKDIIIYKINIDQEQEIASAFGISSIPSILFCPMEGQPQMATGAMAKPDYVKAINEILLKK